MEDPLFDPSSSSSNSSPCSTVTPLYSGLEFWAGGVTKLCVCSAGLSANALVVLVFSRPDMINTFNRLLILLAYFDNAFLFFCLVDSVIVVTHGIAASVGGWGQSKSPFWWLVHPNLLHPMQQVFLTASIYMTVAVSLDRYLAVLHPLSSARRRGTGEGGGGGAPPPFSFALSKARQRRLLRVFGRAHAVAASVLVVAAVYAMPHFFEYDCCEFKEGNLIAFPTAMRLGNGFIVVYAGYVDAVVRTLVPAAVMLFTGSRIVPVVRETYRATGNRNEFALLLTNGFLVLLFMLSHVCKLVYNIYAVVDNNSRSMDEGTCDFIAVLYYAGGIFLALNSSSSIVVYVCVGRRFRSALADLLGIGKEESTTGFARQKVKIDSSSPWSVMGVSDDSAATNRPSTPPTIIARTETTA